MEFKSRVDFPGLLERVVADGTEYLGLRVRLWAAGRLHGAMSSVLVLEPLRDSKT